MRVNPNNLLAILVGLTLNLGFSGAAMAAPSKITVTGVIGNSVTAEDVALQYDLSSWFGKTYTLEMTVDAEGVTGTSLTEVGIPGLVLNTWAPVQVSHSLMIGGVLVSASAGSYASVETVNNFTVPSGLPTNSLPPGMVVGNTYDSYMVSLDGVGFGCVDGVCDSSDDIHENFWMDPEYFWDTNQVDAIADGNLPVLSGAPYFTQGFGFMQINFEQWSATTGAMSAGFIDTSVTSMTVTAVPEAETYAMMLAGLGLVGFMAKRRKQVEA
jgi:hypothetical protein